MAEDRTGVAGSPADATRVAAAPAAAPAGPAGEAGTSAFGVAHQPAPPAVQVGEVLGHTYRIEAFLAKGGMGAVWRARHVVLESEHAIKIILSELSEDPQVIALLNQEARTLRTVKNDAVVEYQGLMLDEHGRRYLVMEFVDGPSLATVIKDRRFTPAEVRTLRERLALGLAAAHEKGIYHRDISPDNVILPGGRIENAKIIDFGIAKSTATGEKTLIGGDFAGKYSYASPEQAGMHGGNVDARSDIYSLGLVLASCAIGFGGKLDMGNSLGSVFEARQKVPDLSRVPAELRQEIAAMLQPKPEDRPQTMQAVVALGGAPALAAPSAAAGKAAAGRRRGGATVAIVAALSFAVVVAAGAAYFLLLAPPRGPSPAALAERSPPAAAAAPDTASSGAAPSAADAAVTAPPAPAATSAPPAASTPPQVAVVPPPAAALDPAEIASRVRLATAGFSCAEIKPSVSAGREVRLAGFVASADDLVRLRTALGGIPDIGSVALDTMAVYGWPHCEVIKLLDETAQPSSPDIAPRLDFNKPGLVYKDGDKLVLQASATSAFDGYLYVDFLDNEGAVLHLLPIPEHPDNRLRAGQGLRLGGDRYAIGAPFGPNLIVAISSPKRLFAARAAEEEDAKTYLPILAKALQDAAAEPGGARPVASYTFINTVAR